jgi:hypothetical protein
MRDLLVKSQSQASIRYHLFATYTQDYLNILQSIPVSRRDLVLGEISVVGKREKIINSLVY